MTDTQISVSPLTTFATPSEDWILNHAPEWVAKAWQEWIAAGDHLVEVCTNHENGIPSYEEMAQADADYKVAHERWQIAWKGWQDEKTANLFVMGCEQTEPETDEIRALINDGCPTGHAHTELYSDPGGTWGPPEEGRVCVDCGMRVE